MSFTRLPYDAKTYQKRVYESASTLPHQLDPIRNERDSYRTCDEPNTCTASTITPFAPRHRMPALVDTESDLLGITRPATKDPSRQYPYKGAVASHTFAPLAEDGLGFSARYTQLDYPQPNREKGLYPERFFNPILDLQRLERLDDNSKIGINSYLAEMDSYKMFVPKPIPDRSLPTPQRRGEWPVLANVGEPFAMDLN